MRPQPLLTPQELRTLSRLDSKKSLWALVFNWGVIALTILLAELIGYKALTLPFAWLVIAARQHGFMIQMHEGSHQRILARLSLNDWVCDFFAAYPIFMKTSVYRQNHLAHHLYVNSDKDPDWVRKAGAWDWKYPMTKKQVSSLAFRYLRGFGVWEMLRMWTHLSGLKRPWSSRSILEKREMVQQIAYYLIAGFILWKLKIVGPFILYWILPQLTFLPLLLRFRSVAEHFGLEYTNEFNQTRNILCSKFESFLIAPFNVSYHLNHHLYPTIPWYNLKKLQALLANKEEFKALAHTNTTYLGRGHGALVNDLIE